MNNLITRIFVLGMLTSSVSVYSQNVGINNNGAAPNTNAILDVDVTTNNKGILIPRLTTAQRTGIGGLGAGDEGLTVYDETTNSYWLWDGTQWVEFVMGDAWKLTGNAGTVAGTNFLGTTDAVDFSIRRNNVEKVRVLNTYTSFMDEIRIRDGGANSGDILVRLYESGADDGIVDIYENNAMNHRLHANGVSIFNNQQISTADVRFETSGQNDMFFIDAGTNRLGINTTAPANVVDFRTTNENIWLTYWENSHASSGAVAQWYQTNAGNGNRVVMGITNYSGSANVASAVMGLSINNTTTGSGGVGVLGSANNESGNAVEGSLFFTGGYSGWAGYFNADVWCSGTYFGSDRRLKKDIKSYSGALQIIDKINPVTYYYDTEKYPGIGFDEGRLQYGFIAQEIEQIIPEMVKDKNLVLNSNEEKTLDMQAERKTDVFKVVNYSTMIPILTQAVKEQQAIIEAQNEKLEELEILVKELQKSLNK